MMTVKINIEPHVAEYIRAKYFDPDVGAVHFPPDLDIYVMIYDLLSKRPADAPVDRGNLELCLPERRVGKDPVYYNYLSQRAARILGNKMRKMMWAELHDLMDENKHIKGINFKESAFVFMSRYCIESISEDALLKNYQRWRDKQRRTKKRSYKRNFYP